MSTHCITEVLAADAPGAIERALDVLRDGGLVAFPTDTVYGVAGKAFEAASIRRLFEVKERESLKAIPILVGDAHALRLVTSGMGTMALRLAETFWPGPLTLVVPRHPALPPELGPQPTVGVRMPDHPVALALLRAAGPLAVTSANLSGGENTTDAQQVGEQLGGRIELILDGGTTPGGAPSTVADCTGVQPVVLREGPIPLDALIGALGKGAGAASGQ